MEIVLKKTTELERSEIEQICLVFKNVFPEHDKTALQFINEFTNTEFGFSYHVLLVNEEAIVGAQSYIPFTYHVGDKKQLFALSVDTMIVEKYRNFDNIYDMWSIGREKIKKKGVSFLLGFPNENAYQLLIKVLGDKNIGDLNIYALPYKIGAYFPKLKILNILSQSFCRLLLAFSHLSFSKRTQNYIIRKDRETFNKFRYKWFDENYNIVNENDFTFVYKIIQYNGIKTAFLMDVNPLTKKNFDRSVRDIFYRSRSDFEIALYVGYLHFCPFSMIKIPKKYEPKTFHFVGNILDKESIESNAIFNVKNWDVNLSNYDLL